MEPIAGSSAADLKPVKREIPQKSTGDSEITPCEKVSEAPKTVKKSVKKAKKKAAAKPKTSSEPEISTTDASESEQEPNSDVKDNGDLDTPMKKNECMDATKTDMIVEAENDQKAKEEIDAQLIAEDKAKKQAEEDAKLTASRLARNL
jgi:hypothetical protein